MVGAQHKVRREATIRRITGRYARLRGSGVRSTVQGHGRGAGGVPTSDRHLASTGSSQNDLALVGASKLTWFLCGQSKFT